MNTKRKIISKVEQLALNAIAHQPDDKAAAEKHFNEMAKKIAETAMQAVDIMDVGDVCRRAVTGAAIQDYDLLAKLLTDKDFDHERLAKAIDALASERPIDYPPTYFTTGWLCWIAKWRDANGGAGRAGNVSGAPRAPEATDADLHEAATEEPTTVGCPSLAPGKVIVHDEPADEDDQRKAQSEQHRAEARRKRKICWKVYGTKVDVCVMGKTQQNGKVYEVRIGKRQTDVSDTYAQCKVNGKVVLTCSFSGGAWMLKRILTAGMQALVNYKAKRNRDSRRHFAKRDASAKAAKAGKVA